MSLSDFACKNAKAKDKPYRLTDGDGLYLLVRNNGSKLWQLRYRYLEKENILSFGKYPLVSLLDARGKRDDAKRLLIAGINPSTKRKEEKTAAITEARTTFGLIAEEYVTRMEERDAAGATVAKTKWLLEDLVREASTGRVNRVVRALQLETEIRTGRSADPGISPAMRADHFVASWQKLDQTSQRQYQAGDMAAYKSTRSAMSDMAKSLQRDPQLESILANHKKALGIQVESGRRLAQELAFNHGIGLGRGWGIGL